MENTQLSTLLYKVNMKEHLQLICDAMRCVKKKKKVGWDFINWIINSVSLISEVLNTSC